MRKGGDTFPGAGLGRRSTVGRNASNRASLDQDLDSILSGGNDGFQQQSKAKGSVGSHTTRSAPGKKGSLTSNATDEDFYSSLAQMAGEDFDGDNDDDESFSEADAKKMADSLAGLDDMESDLFGGSLGNKATPSKSSKPSKAAAPDSKEKLKTDKNPPTSGDPAVKSANSNKTQPTPSSSANAAESSEKTDTKHDSAITKPKEGKKPRKKFDFGEFDEDDPLAGLLSDEEDDLASKPKPKKTSTPKNTRSSGISSQGSTGERTKSSRGHQPPTQEFANLQSPPATPEHQPAVRREKAEEGSTLSPPRSPEAKTNSKREDLESPKGTPQKRGKQTSAQKAKSSKDDINFDSDEDLPGLDDSTEKTPRDSPSPPPRKKQERASRRNSKGSDNSFDGGDDLPDRETRSESPSRQSRFSELLGKKEKNEPKKQVVPKSLDDFMANISSKSNTGSSAANKKVSSPTSEESFQFGGYMPSAASSGSSRSRGGLARPDTAPSSSKRSVRFSDELGLDDELFGNERPSTAPGERADRGQQRKEEKDDSNTASLLEDDKKPPLGSKQTRRQAKVNEKDTPEPKKDPQAEKPKSAPASGTKPSGGGGGGADWLGLGADDDGGLDLGAGSLKPRTPSSQEGKKDTFTAQAPPERQGRQSSPPRRAGRYRGEGDNDEFLRMLGITPDEPPKPKQVEATDEGGKSSLLPWESSGGSPRRVRRWRDQTSQQNSVDEADNASTHGGPLVRPREAATDGGLTENEMLKQRGMEDKRKASFSQETPRPATEQQQQQHVKSPQYNAQQNVVASTPPVVMPESTPSHPGPTHHQSPYAIQQGNFPPQVEAQPYTPQLYHPQYQPAPFASPASQSLPQSISYQLQYQSPAGFQTLPQTPPASLQAPQLSPGIPQSSSLERLEMSKLKAESDLQQSRLMEYQVASEYQEQQKTRLEEEVKDLVKRVQNMEGIRQKKDLDAASKISELEGKVRRLELEREELLTTIESLKTRHKDEMANIDTSHKSHLKTLEESYQRREQRLKEETDLIIAQNSEKFKNLERENADLQASNNRKISILETGKNNEIESLKDIHRRALDQLRQEHEDEIAQLRRLKEQEVSAATSAHAHTKSLQSLMDQVLNSTRQVSDLRQKIEVTHNSGLEERELSARARDEYLKQLQERLLRQQSENDEERARLQGLVAKMELHMREQTRQVDQERWRLTQEESRLKALQAALEDERRITLEQLSAQRAEVQRARDDLVREQRNTMSQMQEERRTLATERAQLSSAHRDLISREKLKTETSVQAEADLDATAVRIKEESAALSVRDAQLKQEEERLKREKQEFERQRSGFDEERDRIGKLGLEVQKRSREIDELCSDAARVRDEGEHALELAERVRVNAESQRAEAEGMLLVIQEKERQLAQDRLAIAHERRLLEKDKQTGRCWQCEGRRTAAAEQIHATDSPAEVGQSSLLASAPGTPDLLVNSLELKRTLRKWSHDKEKDEEFLEQEAKFLNRLQNSHDTSKHKSSLPLNSTVY